MVGSVPYTVLYRTLYTSTAQGWQKVGCSLCPPHHTAGDRCSDGWTLKLWRCARRDEL